jgi:hypothetical protein
MNTVHFILIIGAIIVMGILIININNSISNSKDSSYRNNYLKRILSLAQTKMDEISVKAFDNATVNGTVPGKIPDAFSALPGKEGELYSRLFDDVDDFNNFDTTYIQAGDSIRVRVNVVYVNKDKPEIISNIKTVMKRIEVIASLPPFSPYKKTFFKDFSDEVKLYYYKSF